jgi:hypothetical protein
MAPELSFEDESQTLITTNSDLDIFTGFRPLPALAIPVDEQAPCYFMSNYVITPRHAGRGYFEFLVPLLQTENAESPIALAFSAVALASMAGRPAGRGTRWFADSCLQYTRALKAVNVALQNPVQQKADSTLAAIVMLSFFEVGDSIPGTGLVLINCRTWLWRRVMLLHGSHMLKVQYRLSR